MKKLHEFLPSVAGVSIFCVFLLQPAIVSGESSFTRGNDRFSVRGGVGIAVLSYSEKISGLTGLGGDETDYTSVGPVVEAGIRARVFGGLHLAFDWQGAFILEATETWDNIGTFAGFLVDQKNELDVTQHLLDLTVQYDWEPLPAFIVRPLFGWHWLFQDFTRSDLRFEIAGLSIPVNIAPVTEDFRGNGPVFGLEADWDFSRFRLFGGFRYVHLVNFTADNSLLGKVDSDGRAVRWELGTAIPVGPIELEGKYRGLYQNVDQASNASGAVLPENTTWTHAFIAAVTYRFRLSR